MNQPENRLALIVANDRFDDAQLPDLIGPSNDAAALQRVLGAAERGAFNTELLINASESEIRSRLFSLLRNESEPDDFVMVYYSGHGIRDHDGNGSLYFSARDTRVSAVPPTAVPAQFVLDELDRCKAKRRLLILDCCYAGAAMARYRSNDDERMTSADLEDRGFAVITAATATQRAKDLGPDSSMSPFTSALIDGIENGEADEDGDGWISVDEAVAYVQRRLRRFGEAQRPRLYNRDAEGRLMLSRTVVLPTMRDVLAWARGPDMTLRIRAVHEIEQRFASFQQSGEGTLLNALRHMALSANQDVRAAASRSLERLGRPLQDDSDRPWYAEAVFYEVLVRAFRDSNADGTGDFRGLVEKLDYLEWLGVDCLWIPPFFPSPLRDDGYDVADFTGVHPEIGTIEDFRYFLDQAHQRGIRVIIDFVMNHTSDQHAWFQASRSDPDGPYGDFYVWSDSDELYQEARIIFVDTEPSNWTWDPVRQQYFWHRFFSHQPDLNFDNPAVHDAMLQAMTFWLDMGLDGFSLDGVPYLYERPGTNGENLPETHDFLKKLRRHVDDHYPGRILLAGATQWPEDVVEYFGDFDSGGDECHVCFNSPLTSHIFMSVRRESRFPISEILEQTPPIPDSCQWGIFLRNHDELTLEMVTDEDRDYMWGEYAKDPRMKANIGIRRRLAPLLDNDNNRMELFNALLLSLPGSPVLYYGDEIGMGDNIWLDRNSGLRTPMQWTPDRNAGFSSANPAAIRVAPIQDPIFGYQSVNVAAQLENSSSLLHWMRRMIHLRRSHPAFGLGTFTELGGWNPSVLSFFREYRDDLILCVYNLSRFPQPVEIDLRKWEGFTPVEMLGGTPFPQIGELPYLVMLNAYGFLWLRLPLSA